MTVIFRNQCEKTKECKNNRCYFRQRDVFGRNPFPYTGDDDAIQKIEEEHGSVIFPSLEAKIGTNEIVIICRSFKK